MKKLAWQALNVVGQVMIAQILPSMIAFSIYGLRHQKSDGTGILPEYGGTALIMAATVVIALFGILLMIWGTSKLEQLQKQAEHYRLLREIF